MPGTAIGLSLNNGYLGQVSRNGDNIISSKKVRPTDATSVNFGDPLVANADATGGSYSSVAGFIVAGGVFTAALFAGIAVRQAKSALSFLTQNTVGQYAPGTMADGLLRGSATVKCNVGVPQAQGAVYVRITANGAIPAGVVGGYEAAADGVNTVQLPNVKFTTGSMDANGVVEITILERNAA